MSELKCLLAVIVCVVFLHSMGNQHTAVRLPTKMLQILPVMNNVIKTNPPEHSFVKTFCGMFSDMDHLEEELHAERKNIYAPATNIYETDTLYHIEVALPGYQRSDIQLKREKDLITISANTHTVRHKNLQRSFRQEFVSGSFSRSFLLPDDAGIASAVFAEGVLSITLDKNFQGMTQTAMVQVIQIK